MDQVILYGLFILGLILIIKGGDAFVDGAAWIADAFGIPKVIVGATIVSLATTMPELLVSCFATAGGKVDMAIGNAIGSVIANTGLILALSIVCLGGAFSRKHLGKKVVILFAAVLALILATLSGELTFIGGIGMFLVFLAFIYENIRTAKAEITGTPEEMEVNRKTIWKNVLLLLLGAVAIVVGSQLLVNKGSEIAAQLGIPESIIGLTAIAIGTSLPELVTAITAIVKKQGALSVGNIIGANIIDTTMILPICSFLSHGGLPVSQQNRMVDFPMALLLSAIAMIPSLITKKFQKWQGILLFLVYGLYLAYVCGAFSL